MAATTGEAARTGPGALDPLIAPAIGLGNAVDVGHADLLGHLAADPRTGAIALHLEGVRDGRRLVAADAFIMVQASAPAASTTR
jgi:hypothetical protein